MTDEETTELRMKVARDNEREQVATMLEENAETFVRIAVDKDALLALVVLAIRWGAP